MLILEADPEMIEERKWKKPSKASVGVPVWSHHGIVCTGETYKEVVKLTFAHGASLPDPAHLFNAGLGGGTRRAIDILESGLAPHHLQRRVRAPGSNRQHPRRLGQQRAGARRRSRPWQAVMDARRLIYYTVV